MSYYWWIDARKFNGYGSAVKPPVASTGTPGTVKPPANGPKVGDIVEFTGSAHYYSANATKSSPCKPGKAKVTQAFNGKHPYHLIAVKGGGSTVYGWVDRTLPSSHQRTTKWPPVVHRPGPIRAIK